MKIPIDILSIEGGVPAPPVHVTPYYTFTRTMIICMNRLLVSTCMKKRTIRRSFSSKLAILNFSFRPRKPLELPYTAFAHH